MKDILEQCEQPYDRYQLLVCFNEWLKQLIKMTRMGKPGGVGRVERYDEEYKHNANHNLNIAFVPLSNQ